MARAPVLLVLLALAPAALAAVDAITDLRATSVKEGSDTTVTAECLPASSSDPLTATVYRASDDAPVCSGLSVACNGAGAACTMDAPGPYYVIAEGGGKKATAYFSVSRDVGSALQIPDASPAAAASVLALALLVLSSARARDRLK